MLLCGNRSQPCGVKKKPCRKLEQGYNPPQGPFPEGGCRSRKASQPKRDHGTGSKSEPRWHMSPLVWMLTVWGVLTGVLVILLIYRGTLTMQEDDQLFLDDTKSQMQQDQADLIAKVNKINPFVKILGAASGIMFLVIAGMFIYQGLNNTAF